MLYAYDLGLYAFLMLEGIRKGLFLHYLTNMLKLFVDIGIMEL